MQLDLHGIWDIRSTDGKYVFKGEVPGTVFLYMEQNGIFGPDGVFYREENRKCVELSRRDFIFSRTFSISDELLKQDAIYLEADGLDTIAKLTINGKLIGTADNMHRRYVFDIKSELKDGKNSIEVLFENTLDYIDKEHARRPLGHSYWNMPDYAYQGFNMIRKSHCSYGWDWGPIIPDIGIHRNIRISAYSCARITSVHVTQEHDDNAVALLIKPELKLFGDVSLKDIVADITITSPDGNKSFFLLNNDGTTRIEIDNPRLWWPNGLGGQPLYRLDFRLTYQCGSDCDGEQDSMETDRYEMKIGLRTITVRRDPDQWGESFTFEVNGVPVFARGADLIPEDVFLTRVDDEKTARLLQSCVDANFNCIRVWGGGVYPRDAFFDLCDRLGLIVWQDFMFACASYDINNPRFLENISNELRDNIRRIRHHASLGLFCGNNEMEWGIKEWEPRPTPEMITEYLKQYQWVFPQIIAQECPEVFYWPSSPSSGGDFDEPNSADRGDTHFWKVWHGDAEYTEYHKHYFRFMSEFGFESFPSMKTIRSFTEEEDLNVFSPVMEDHQRCLGGNGKILNYIARYFRFPKDLDSLVYLSQVSQAEAMRHGIEHWRRHRGRCMGSVYWQLNDNWPVASWSSIDYYGRWKALHYTVKRSYDNTLLSICENNHSCEIWLSNEGTGPVSGTLEWHLSDMDGNRLTGNTRSIAIDSFQSECVETVSSEQLMKSLHKTDAVKEKGTVDHNIAEARKLLERNTLLFACFITEDEQIFRSFFSFGAYKVLSLKNPDIAVTVSEDKDRAVINVSTQRPALFIELDLSNGDCIFSDNWFSMPGGSSMQVLAGLNGLSIDEFRSQLRVRSIINVF